MSSPTLLVDTNVISELARPRPNAGVLRWAESVSVVAIARVSGELRGRLAARGTTRTQADMLIAATAHVHQLTLVTRNTRDFEESAVALLNPFS